MNITISVTEDFLKRLDEVRGPAGRSAFIRWAVGHEVDYLAKNKGIVALPKDVGKVPAKSIPAKNFSDKYEEARVFCKMVKGITYEIDYSKEQEFIAQAGEIAGRNGLEVVGKWFRDPETDKFICSWK